MRFIFSAPVALSLLFHSGLSQAADNTFDYPELSVVPRASERIEVEAARERELGWSQQLPLLVPATMTLVSGLAMINNTQFQDNPAKEGARYAPAVGIGVGLAWWGVSLGILNRLDIYADGAAEVARMPAKTQREQLLRERRAEEAIYRAGSLACRLKWISLVTNLGASVYMAGSAKDKSFQLYLAGASAVAAFTPLLFPHRWSVTESLHRDYKKRIYGALSSISPTVLADPNGQAFSPGLMLSLRF